MKRHQGYLRFAGRLTSASFRCEALEARQLLSTTHDYFINDSNLVGDQFTSAPGDDANSGLSASAPMASINSLLAKYTFIPGDRILVDSGNYLLTDNIVLDSRCDGLTILGPTGGGAVIDRQNPDTGSYAFELQGVSNLTLSHLEITGAETGVYASATSGSTFLTISDSVLQGNCSYGAWLGSSNAHVSLLNNSIYGLPGNLPTDNQSTGAEIDGADALVTGNTVHNSNWTGLLVRSSRGQVRDNTIWGNSDGLQVSGTGDQTDWIQVSSNRVYDNTHQGIFALCATVTDNQVYGQLGYQSTGIYLESSVRATNNTVFENYQGIAGYYYSEISGNTVFDNADAGLLIGGGVLAHGNRVYNNAIGIETEGGYWNGGEISNNLIWNNASQGIVIHSSGAGAYPPKVLNNTIIQSAGEAIRLEWNCSGVILENNILQVDSGYGLWIARDSQNGVVSDYNLYSLGNGAKLGFWQGQDGQADWDMATLPDWFAHLRLDAQSLQGDPRFRQPTGPDGIQGFSVVPTAAAQILDDTSFTPDAYTLASTVSGWGVGGSYQQLSGFYPGGSWSASGLVSGKFYQLAVNWPASSDWSGDVTYEIFDGQASLAVIHVNQQTEAGDFSDQGQSWKSLGYYLATAGSLQVKVTSSSENVAVDGLYLRQIAGNAGADDNFLLASDSPGIDRGEPHAAYLNEPGPNGSRINLGYEGNTSSASLSAQQSIQILSPGGLADLITNTPVTIEWKTQGVGPANPVALMNVGGSTRGYWQGDSGGWSTSTSVDTSGVSNPAPLGVYQTWLEGDTLAWQLPISDGSYTLRLHFMEASASVGDRRFDIRLQNQTVASGFDIAAQAGGTFRAVTASFNLTATGGSGLSLALISQSADWGASLCGIEVLAAPGISHPTYNVAFSPDNGVSWTTLQTAAPVDAWGRGTLSFTPTQTTTQGRLRIISNDVPGLQSISAEAIHISASHGRYYLNDSSTAGDQFTSAVGNDSNDGLSPATPMASIVDLLRRYSFAPGDMIYVDSGNYLLRSNITLDSAYSGLTILGTASIQGSVFNRGDQSSSAFVFDLRGVNNLTLDHLGITGGLIGVNGSVDYNSTGLTIRSSVIQGNSAYGVYLDKTHTGAQIQGNSIYGTPGTSQAQSMGISVEGADAQISSNRVENNTNIGISLSGERGTIYGNWVSGNNDGIAAFGGSLESDWITVAFNTVTGNFSHGITASHAQVESNTVFGQVNNDGVGIYLADRSEVTGNLVFGNILGVSVYYYTAESSSITSNTIYNNAQAGLASVSAIQAFNNRIYSNGVGLELVENSLNTTSVADNLIYANTLAGIRISSTEGTYDDQVRIFNNTLYEPQCSALVVSQFGRAILLRNNIIYSGNGDAISLTADSQNALNSDYNVLNCATGAHLVQSGTDTLESIAAWRLASSQDLHSTQDPVRFVDVDGADNVLGYSSLAGGYNGGEDDNFSLSHGSAGIDAADSNFAPITDLYQISRRDDPGTSNVGTAAYQFAERQASVFAAGGVAQNWKGNAATWGLILPFDFQFYGVSYASVSVSSSGYLLFGGPLETPSNRQAPASQASLAQNILIAPLWGNLNTLGASDDIFVDTSIADQVTIRWHATVKTDGSEANFAVVLFRDGHLRFDYGGGNNASQPVIGISAGNGLTFLTSIDSGAESMTNAASQTIGFQSGTADMGALEFLGSSADVTPLRVSSSSPAALDASGEVGFLSSITLNFNRGLDRLDARNRTLYDLRQAGSDGLFDTADDLVYSLSSSFLTEESLVTLNIFNGPLAAGSVRLTVHGLHDLSGYLLDGDANGSEGGDYQRFFQVNAHPTTPLVTLDTPASSQEGTLCSIGGSFVDPDADETWNATVNYGDGSAVETVTLAADKTFTMSHSFANSGSYWVEVSVRDTAGHIGQASLAIVVGNVAPTADFANGGAVFEGSQGSVFFNNAWDVSPADRAAGFTYSFDFDNDGTFEIVGSSSAGAVVPASYLLDGPMARTLRGRITDKDGGYSDYTTTINVMNAAPGVVVSADASAGNGENYRLHLTLSDPGIHDGHSVMITWGDGSSSGVYLSPSISSIDLNHRFVIYNLLAPWTNWTIGIRVTDSDGAENFQNQVISLEPRAPGIFSESFYLQTNPDIQAAVTAGAIKSGWEHFLKWGQFENRRPNGLFDPAYYLACNPDVAAAVSTGQIASAFEHFMLAGQQEGRRGAGFFDESYYLSSNPDVKAAVTAGVLHSGFEHFLNWGQKEDRSPNAFFQEAYYLTRYPDVAGAVRAGIFTSGYEHFVASGARENRSPSLYFQADYYLAHNPDVAAAVASGYFKSGFEHFLLYGNAENRPATPYFNAAFYLSSYSDAVTAIQAGLFTSALDHYLRSGSGHNPLAFFDEAYYLLHNGDVAAAVRSGQIKSGFEHFIFFGQREGRPASPLFNEADYLALNPDVAAAVAGGAFVSGFEHYLLFGFIEGRSAHR